VVLVRFFVGRDAVVGGVEGALEGGYGGGGWVGGCCKVLFVTNLPLQMDGLLCATAAAAHCDRTQGGETYNFLNVLH